MTRLNDGGSSVSHCTRLNQDDAPIASASVARLVQDSDIEAEYTIGWVRIFVAAALFIGGFSVSSGVSWLDTVQLPHQPLSVALIAVVAFLALGIASLILAARRWSKPWLAFALVTGDVAILALSLFFGLKVNDLNGNWIAAMPVVWVAPLVLTLGALRYRPAVQVWITVLLIFSLITVALTLGFRPFLDKSETLSSAVAISPTIEWLFLLPSYLMRTMILILVGLTTALVMMRARRLLLRAITETVHRVNIARFLPAEIAPLMGAADSASWRRGRRQQATIVFVDMRDSTAFAENMDPTRLSIFISSFRRRVTRAVEAHRGMVDKFVGDGALVVFGVPEPKPDDSARAIACAHHILALINRWNVKRGFHPPIRVGIGIHGGEVYCGIIGDEHRLEFTVLGDVVNVAARIEQATKEFEVPLLASEAVVAGAGQLGVWHELSRKPLRGRAEAVAILAPP